MDPEGNDLEELEISIVNSELIKGPFVIRQSLKKDV